MGSALAASNFPYTGVTEGSVLVLPNPAYSPLAGPDAADLVA